MVSCTAIPGWSLRAVWLVLAALCAIAPDGLAKTRVSELRSDETILFYPTFAVASTNGGWDLWIHGSVIERESARLSLAFLRSALRLDGIKMTKAELATFKTRARLFFADNERGHRVVVRVGGVTFDLGKSAPNGHFKRRIHLSELPKANPSNMKSVEFSAVLKPGDSRKFSGVALLFPANGLSVVSDIDDTIKISDVSDHKELLRRTFLQPFEPVPGMAGLYRAWATNGVLFHYVSASPWQLFLPLAEFVRTNGFPQGTWTMKQWRLKGRSFKSLFEDPKQYKMERISALLREFPQRHFILIGDSGERDPEAYAALAREFPSQVVRIFIRDASGRGVEANAERFRKDFAGLPRTLWREFESPSELLPLLPQPGSNDRE